MGLVSNPRTDPGPSKPIRSFGSLAFRGSQRGQRVTSPNRAVRFFSTRRKKLVVLPNLDARGAGIVQAGRNGTQSRLFSTASTSPTPSPVIVAAIAAGVALFILAT